MQDAPPNPLRYKYSRHVKRLLCNGGRQHGGAESIGDEAMELRCRRLEYARRSVPSTPQGAAVAPTCLHMPLRGVPW